MTPLRAAVLIFVLDASVLNFLAVRREIGLLGPPPPTAAPNATPDAGGFIWSPRCCRARCPGISEACASPTYTT